MQPRLWLGALVVGMGIAATWRVYENWHFALDLEAGTRAWDPEILFLEAFHPGLPEAARLIASTPAPVYSMPREAEPLVHQRLLEMVFPRRPAPYDTAALKSGDLVVLAAGTQLDVPSEELFGRGLVRIVRVR